MLLPLVESGAGVVVVVLVVLVLAPKDKPGRLIPLILFGLEPVGCLPVEVDASDELLAPFCRDLSPWPVKPNEGRLGRTARPTGSPGVVGGPGCCEVLLLLLLLLLLALGSVGDAALWVDTPCGLLCGSSLTSTSSDCTDGLSGPADCGSLELTNRAPVSAGALVVGLKVVCMGRSGGVAWIGRHSSASDAESPTPPERPITWSGLWSAPIS